jgi:hypothetical protein
MDALPLIAKGQASGNYWSGVKRLGFAMPAQGQFTPLTADELQDRAIKREGLGPVVRFAKIFDFRQLDKYLNEPLQRQ